MAGKLSKGRSPARAGLSKKHFLGFPEAVEDDLG
jgi:hypothetical protein